ncbi:hypothetical protein SAMN05660199_00239 [Klenkia soli]|uniref:DUF4367 domain-containing protein n=1 Tax=Klenkia soli TaxID=1052260 RepID=A0A1H0C900_9ACTN|nr:hypothetical protein [Klenkia soli]SDN54370.1 hypothetical protein SAMN05660199_00239 [Klenkia soli]
MITDRDLDAQLAAAARVHDADLPPLPPAFLDELRAPTEVEPASVLAARQLVDDARRTRTTARRRPRRRTVVRLGAVVLAVAAAWTTAVLVTPGDTAPPAAAPPTTTGAAPSTVVQAPGSALTLVATEAPTFPLSLDPEPDGLTATFSRWGGTAFYPEPLVFSADYTASDGSRFLLRLFQDDPREAVDSGWSVDGTPAGTGDVDGSPADIRQVEGGGTSVLWQRPDGRWVQLLGEGSYDDRDALLTLAGTVVDRPQPVGLQFGLAPAGWTVGGYEESRSLDLVSDTDPAQVPLRVSLTGTPGPDVTVDSFFEGRSLTGAVEQVTVQGLPARLGLTTPDDGDSWLLAGQVPDGRLFLLLAPPALTRDQVLQIGEQVTVTG